ncbi:MAG: hypothetical protein JNM17_11960 [Archangium sp.]|nr:hypothetical protein [Archangium sp.]
MADGTPLTRLSPLVVPMLVVLVLSVGALFGVARYTQLLDPVPAGLPPTDALHHGPRPCLRYPTDPDRSSTREAARALAKAGVTSSLVTELLGDLYARRAAREATLHVRDEADEALDALVGSGLRARLVMAAKRDLLREQLIRVLREDPQGTTTIASLPREQREAIDAQWVRDPAVFVLPGVMDLLNQLKRQATEELLGRLVATFEKELAAGNEPVLGADGFDAWGTELRLERAADELTITSLGADRAPGGGDVEADLTRTLKAPARAAAPSPTCEGKTELSLSRSEVDAALEDLAEVSKEVRVVPAMSDGVVTGFKLQKLRAGFFLHAGLCENDVVRTLNGVALSSPDRALEAYSRLKGASRVEIAITREGKPVTLVVQVR